MQESRARLIAAVLGLALASPVLPDVAWAQEGRPQLPAQAPPEQGVAISGSSPFHIDMGATQKLSQQVGRSKENDVLYRDLLVPDGFMPATTPSRSFDLPEFTFQVVPPADGGEVVREEGKRSGKPLPEPLLDEMERAASDRCNQAAVDWGSEVPHLDKLLSTLADGRMDKLHEVLDATERARLLALAKAYDQACLSSTEDLPEERIDDSFKNVIAVVLNGDQPVCGALRLQEDLFVTARHCVAAFDADGGSTLALLSDPSQRFTAQLVAARAPALRSFYEHHHGRDFAFLVSSKVNQVMPNLQASVPILGQRVFLAGYYRFHDPEWIFSNSPTRGPRKDWAEGLRWSRAPLCVIGPTRDPCFAHLCQSDFGFSGTALLAADGSSELKYFGIHVAAMGGEDSCGFETRARTFNIGIIVDPANAIR